MTNRPTPQPGEIYRHFKGTEYEIWGIAEPSPMDTCAIVPNREATHTETGERHAIYYRWNSTHLLPSALETTVLYFSPRTPDRLWARPLSNFMEMVEGPGGEAYRFKKVEADELLTRPILQGYS